MNFLIVLSNINRDWHCVKTIQIRSYSGPYFPSFRLNTDQNNSEYGYFLRSEILIKIKYSTDSW